MIEPVSAACISDRGTDDLPAALTGHVTAVGLADLQSLGPAEQHAVPIHSIVIQLVTPIPQLDALFQQWRRLSGQHGLIDDRCSLQEEEVAGDTGIGFRTSDGDEIAGKEEVGGDLGPLVVPVHVEREGLNGHGPELGQRFETLNVNDTRGNQRACTI